MKRSFTLFYKGLNFEKLYLLVEGHGWLCSVTGRVQISSSGE